MNSGIYKITCIINNKFYIGSTKNIADRWYRHLYDLKNNNHINIHLQRSFNKYGKSSFNFEIVENCDEDILLLREQYYLDMLKPYEFGFNIGKNAAGGDNLTHNPKKDEIIERIKKSVNEKLSNMTEEERKEKWSKPGELNPNWRGGTSSIKYYCECGKNKGKKSKTCSDCRERIGDKNPFFNKKHNSETKKLISEKRIGKYFGSQNIPVVINEIEYESLGKAKEYLNIPITTIRWRILSKNPKYENYKYKDEN